MATNEERIQLATMQQLSEAKKLDDDWTGLADSKARRKKQNRLNQRAYRRRKALEAEWTACSYASEAHDWSVPIDPTTFQRPASFQFPSQPIHNSLPQTQLMQADWVTMSQPPQVILPQLQPVEVTPASHNSRLNSSDGIPASSAEATSIPEPIVSPKAQALIPYTDHPQGHSHQGLSTLIFPLPVDHLLTLVQYNVLRATLANMSILSLLHLLPSSCGSVLSWDTMPTHIPATFTPTALQLSVPHEYGIDIVPLAQMRDNMILLAGKYDHDDLCNDLVGGLYEGFNDVERRGMMVWCDPWRPDGWEVTEGFLRKWGFLLRGCGELIESTNRWRALRYEESLIFEV